MGSNRSPRILILLSFSFLLLCKSYAQLQPETKQQIQALLDEKNSRTPAERKIQSQLLQVIRESKGKPMVQGSNLLPAKVDVDKQGNIKVTISATVTETLLKKITDWGGTILFSSKEYNSITAMVNLASIDSLSNMAEVKFIRKGIKPRTVGAPIRNKIILAKDSAATAPLKKIKLTAAEREQRIKALLQQYLKNEAADNAVGIGKSEGDHTHGADKTRNTFGYTGKGVRIGVISDSYNATSGAATDVLNGDLPGTGNPYGHTTPVKVVADYTQSDGTDEGRAMLQIVHDLAPDALLYFATGNVSEASFATNIIALGNSTNKCDIIIDDLGYFDEPVFQDGIIAKAVDSVTAKGIMYFSAAGNSGNLLSNTSGVFEGDFNDAGSAAFTKGSKTGTIHNFGTTSSPINGDIITVEGGEYTLNWADPQGLSSNDYDLFLVSSSGTVKASSTDVQSGTQDPIEMIDPPTAGLAAGDRLIVFKKSTAARRAFNINTTEGELTIATNGQILGHPCAIDAFAVSATPAVGNFGDGNSPTGPYPGIFVSTNTVEDFSSDGPRRIFFTPMGTAITPGNFLFSTNGGQVLQKPDITAADGVTTNVSSTSEFTPFFGTSAAAPHAGAIAGLLKSAKPSLTSAQIRTILTSTALDIDAPGYDVNSGYGILQAFQAMQAVNPAPLPNVDIDTVITREDSLSNNNGAIDPGEAGIIYVTLKNPSGAIDSSIRSVITTTTSGVTITQGTANYGILNLGDTATQMFTFTVSPTIACGTPINIIDTVYFNGSASPQIFMFSINAGSQPFANISSKLGSTPPTGTGYTAVTGTQKGRINRQTDGTISSCDAALANPGALTGTGSTSLRAYDAYTITNTSAAAQCVTVTMSSPNADSLFCVAYNSTGFVSNTPKTNFLADGGNSYSPEQYSFTAPAGKAFTIVVHAVDAATAVGSPYTLNVSLSQCSLVYIFTGNGNWNVAANWLGQTIPPATLPAGSQILINPLSTGECILNTAQTISTGATIKVEAGKKLRILSNLLINN